MKESMEKESLPTDLLVSSSYEAVYKILREKCDWGVVVKDGDFHLKPYVMEGGTRVCWLCQRHAEKIVTEKKGWKPLK